VDYFDVEVEGVNPFFKKMRSYKYVSLIIHQKLFKISIRISLTRSKKASLRALEISTTIFMGIRKTCDIETHIYAKFVYKYT
jgi:hypothetical protein